MRKICVINDFPIFPVVHGGKVRIFNIYKNISSRFQIIYICLGDEQKIEKKKVSDNFMEISIPKKYLYKKIIQVSKKLVGRSIDDLIALFFASWNHQFITILKRQIQDSDIVILCHPYLYPSAKPFIRNKMVIYEALNVESVLKDSILPESLVKRVGLHRLKQVEKDLLQQCDLCFTMSEDDKSLFTQMFGAEPAKITVAPNGVDEDFYTGIYLERMANRERVITSPLIVFLGSGHPPNVEAAQQIIKNIAPHLQDAYFLIAGSVCWMVENNPMGKNVGLAYFISDEEKKELFGVADIGINPMMSGSGTNLKMLDYMAAGLPVISTAIGARGIDLENGRHAIVCDIDAFAEKISQVLNSKELQEELSLNGRNLVSQRYDWKKIADSMGLSLEQLIQT